MRILLAVDDQPYSEYALGQMVNLAKNTWADVTILGVHPVSHGRPAAGAISPADLPLSKALRKYREIFLKSWKKEESPYETQGGQYEWITVKDGVFEEVQVFRGRKKEFKLRLRMGNPTDRIVSESAEEETDLIILGCPKGQSCEWKESGPTPQGVVNDADRSVLVVKEEQPVRRILACLDQGYISQESLETINQMVTIHSAGLELIGLSQDGEMKKDVYTRLIEVGDYYSDKDIEVKTRLADVSEFEKVIAEEAQHNLLALWMGKKSLLSRLFSRGWVGRFVSGSPSSVLVMR
jgi:nucleotide-binding universal stress UspA family protein